MKKKAGYGLTDIDDGHPTMHFIQVPLERIADEGNLSQNIDEDADCEGDSDENCENQEFREAAWALNGGHVSESKASG